MSNTSHSPKQLGFSLKNLRPFSSKYLVVHSGISSVTESITESIEQFKNNSLKNNSSKLILISVIGQKGSGKTHVLNFAQSEFEKNDVSFKIFDDLDLNSDCHSDFVSSYEKLKISGGVIVVSFKGNLDSFSPHITSRLSSAKNCYLQRPKEDEYRDILVSLMHRDNFNLSEKTINYVLSRLPADTLSLKALSDKLKSLSEQSAKSAKFFTVRDVVNKGKL